MSLHSGGPEYCRLFLADASHTGAAFPKGSEEAVSFDSAHETHWTQPRTAARRLTCLRSFAGLPKISRCSALSVHGRLKRGELGIRFHTRTFAILCGSAFLMIPRCFFVLSFILPRCILIVFRESGLCSIAPAASSQGRYLLEEGNEFDLVES